MSTEFEQDCQRVLVDVDAARNELLLMVGGLSDTDLDVGRRGAWSVRGVLQHIVTAEWGHTRGIKRLLGEEDPEIPESPALETGAAVVDALSESRAAHLSSVDGIEEDAFYRLAVPNPAGGQEWSVMSFLEGTADHDREHQHQIDELLGS
jgi:hypothetical protein